jgi:hypothetical protein
MIWSDESSFTVFPTSGRVYVCRTPKEAYSPECLVPTLKHRESSVMVLASISWYNILLVLLLPFMASLLQGSTATPPLHPFISPSLLRLRAERNSQPSLWLSRCVFKLSGIEWSNQTGCEVLVTKGNISNNNNGFNMCNMKINTNELTTKNLSLKNHFQKLI